MNFCPVVDYKNYADYVIGGNTPIKTDNGCKSRIFFDNGATTLISYAVVNKINSLFPYYTYPDLGNYNSDDITKQYNESRDIVKSYLGADKDRDTVIYVKNSTFGLNTFANAIMQECPCQIVLTTKMEHLANFLPYKERVRVELINILPNGNIDMEDYKKKLITFKGKIKYVCVTGASNITGIIPPFYEMARIAHQNGAKIMVDIVQLLQHKPFDMKPYNDIEHIDFVTFSAHKVYTGFDGGALVGPASFFNQYMPLEFGAGATKFVNSKTAIFDDSPTRYEPGYPNTMGIIAMGTSLKSLSYIGLQKIASFEAMLYEHLLAGLKKIPNIIFYGVDSNSEHIPFLAFNIPGIKPSTIENKLGYGYGIEITSGLIGADVYVQSLLGLTDEQAYELYMNKIEYGVARVSLAFYNTIEEIDFFLKCLNEVIHNS